MVKPEWGTKRTCPKCSTRFYDLGNDDPVHCINCGTDFVPEPVLKSKQPLAFEAVAPAAKEPAPDSELEAEDLAVDEDAEISADRKSTSRRATTISAWRPPARTTTANRPGFGKAGPRHSPFSSRGKFAYGREDVGP